MILNTPLLLYSFSQFATLGIIFLAIIFLIVSILFLKKITYILKFNEYKITLWLFISLLIIFQLFGYFAHLFVTFEVVESIVDPFLVVSVIYLFGSTFVLIAMYSVNSMVKAMLGEIIPDEKAISTFLSKTKISKSELTHLHDEFNIVCNHCNKEIAFTIADVVRQHYNLVDKGFQIETTFGVKSILLRSTHKCIDGRREIVTIHDYNLAYRSIDTSRIILASTL